MKVIEHKQIRSPKPSLRKSRKQDRPPYMDAITALHKKDDFKSVRAISMDYLLVAVGFFTISQTAAIGIPVVGILVNLLAQVLIASRFRALECLVHEASHYNVFKEQRLNLLLEFLFAYPVFRSVVLYRASHSRHHRYGFDSPEDPDVEQAERWGILNMQSKSEVFRKMILRPATGYFTYDYIRYSFLPFMKRMATGKEKGALLYWALVLGLTIALGGMELFLYGFVIPFFLITPIIRFIAESSEHVGFPIDLKNPNRNARNNVGFLHRNFLHPHGDGFHQIHHKFPSMPYYNLGKAYALLKNEEIAFVESHSVAETLGQMTEEEINFHHSKNQ